MSVPTVVGLLVPVTGPAQLVVLPAESASDFVAALIGAEVVGAVRPVRGDWQALVDDNAAFSHLPPNELGSTLARREGWGGTYLLGPMLFVGEGPADADGERPATDVPQRMITFVADLVEVRDPEPAP